MEKRKSGLSKNPEAQAKLQEAIELGLQKTGKVKEKLGDIRGLLASPEISNAMTDILEMSNLSTVQKKFLKMVFIEKVPKKKAIARSFGRDLGYQEEAITQGIMNHTAVKEFLDMVKMFYVKVSPIAALKEVEILMSDDTPADVKLKAAASISSKAGIGERADAARDLPVNIQINMPTVNNIVAEDASSPT